jgi:hypothetical protein
MSKQPFSVKLLSHNIAEITLDDNVYLDVSVTDRIDEELHKLGPDRKFFQMVIASGPYIVNPEMRNSMSEGDTGTKLLGVAWVSPDEEANREQEAIVSQLSLPVPIRFFSDREKGLAWLQGLASDNQKR